MVTWRDKKFYINDEPIEIHAGAIHYFRSTPDRWREYLLKLKNCGFNAVETYCAWNLHEPQEGTFDFSGRLDVVRFVELAEEVGLYVVLRPGPYICAEWEFGGFPAWLLKDKNFRFRTTDGDFLTYVERYFDRLLPPLAKHSEANGGNIILIAAENEYGSLGNDRNYMNKCAELLKKYEFNIPIFTADGHSDMFLKGGRPEDCLCALDFGFDGEVKPEHYEGLENIQPDAPFFRVEFWNGQFSHWGEPVQHYDAELVAHEVKQHLEHHDSFNMYMFHGGTNFGFTNGANYFPLDPNNCMKFTYLADTTSYDYGAMLTEWGEVTPKYLKVQKVMSEHLGVEFPTPEPVPVMALGEVALTEAAGLFSNLDAIGEHYQTAVTRHMEHYGQNYGYILYRTQVPANDRLHLLAIDGLADRVNIYFNGEWKGVIHRNDEKQYLEADGWLDCGGTLELLVENQGRINFGPMLDLGDRKGIDGHVYVTQQCGPTQILYNWDVYTLSMEDLTQISYDDAAVEANRPVFYRGTFKAEEKKESFIHLDHFGKGFVVVNGFHLGRYWEIGPQKSIYLPSSILKDENEIVVFTEKPTETPVLSILDYHILHSFETDKGPETIV